MGIMLRPLPHLPCGPSIHPSVRRAFARCPLVPGGPRETGLRATRSVGVAGQAAGSGTEKATSELSALGRCPGKPGCRGDAASVLPRHGGAVAPPAGTSLHDRSRPWPPALQRRWPRRRRRGADSRPAPAGHPPSRHGWRPPCCLHSYSSPAIHGLATGLLLGRAPATWLAQPKGGIRQLEACEGA